MFSKDNIRNIWIVVKEYFFVPFCLSIFAIFTVLSIFHLQFYIITSYFFLYAGLMFGFLSLLFLYDKYYDSHINRKLIIEFTSILFLLSLSFLILIDLDNNFLDTITLPHYTKIFLIFFAIFSGCITFYLNQKKTEETLDDNNIKLSRIENINKFSNIFNFSRWFYKTCLNYNLIILLVILFSFILKSMYSYHWFFFRDEFNILSQAKINLFLNNFEYKQLWILIELQTWIYKIFGFTKDLFINRLPYIIFSLVNISLIYIILKKVFKKNIAIITSFLFSISAFSIEMSLYIRQYEFNLMCALIMIYLALNVKNIKTYLLILGVYIFGILYSLYIQDGYYVASLLVLPAILYSGYIIIRNNYLNLFYNLQKKILYCSIFILIFVVFLLIYILSSKTSWLFSFNFNYDWIDFLYINSFGIGDAQLVLFAVTLFIYFFNLLNFKKGVAKLNILLVTSFAIIIMYTFFINRYFAPRYIYYFFPLYILLTVGAIMQIYKNKLYQKILVFIMFCSVLLSTINYYKNNQSYSRYIGTYNFNSLELESFLNTNPISTIITSNSNEVLFFTPKKITCVRNLNEERGYQTLCDIINFSEVSSVKISNKDLLLITDWRRNPLTKNSVDIPYDYFNIKKIISDSNYKIYEVNKIN